MIGVHRTLRGVGSVFDCGGGLSSRQLQFEWRQSEGDLPPAFADPQLWEQMRVAQDPRLLRLPLHRLRVCHTYAFTLTVTLHGTSQFSNATAWVSVVPNDLVAVISGGSRKVGSSAPLVLDATASYDPDNVTAPLVFNWSCELSESNGVKGRCLSRDGSVLALAPHGGATATVSLPAGLLPPATYTFTVGVWNGSAPHGGCHSPRHSQHSVDIQVEAGAPPPVVSISPVLQKVNPNAKLVLEMVGPLPAGVALSWQQLAGDLDTRDSSSEDWPFLTDLTSPVILLFSTTVFFSLYIYIPPNRWECGAAIGTGDCSLQVAWQPEVRVQAHRHRCRWPVWMGLCGSESECGSFQRLAGGFEAIPF